MTSKSTKELVKENNEILSQVAEVVSSVPNEDIHQTMVKIRRQRQREDIAWYTKWFSSIVVMVAMTLRSTGETTLLVWDLYLSTIGIFGWLVVSLLWKDRALILLNGFGLLVLLSGVIKSFI